MMEPSLFAGRVRAAEAYDDLRPSLFSICLLHDVFDYGYDENVRTVGKSEDNCRQLATRAPATSRSTSLASKPPSWIPRTASCRRSARSSTRRSSATSVRSPTCAHRCSSALVTAGEGVAKMT